MDLQSKSEATRKQYNRAMDRFLEYSNLTHNELFQIHYQALQSPDPRDKYKVSRMVKACMANLKESGLSSSTTYTIYKAVSSFLTSQGLDFKLQGTSPKISYQGQRIIEKGEIRSLLEATSGLRNKAMIYTLKDSGLRVSDIVQLNYGHVKEAIDSESEFILIRLRQTKNDILALPILGPESLNAIKKWIDSRKRMGKTLDDSSPLFCQIEGSKKGEVLKSASVSTTIRKLVEKCGLKDVSAHSFRKFNTTMLQAGGVPETWITIIQGRKITDSRSAYVQPTDSQLIHSYSKAYSSLSIEDMSNIERVEALEEEVNRLRQELEKFESVQKILDNPRKWLQAQDAYPPNCLTQDQFWEWMNQRHSGSRIDVNDANITEPETISLEDKIKDIVKNVLTEKNHSTYAYRTLEINNEKELISRLEEGWEIYREINGKIILRKLK